MRPSFSQAARDLAEALVAADWRLDDLLARGTRALGKQRPPRWLVPVVSRLLEAFWRARPSPERIALWLLADSGFQRALSRGAVQVQTAIQPVPSMAPALGGRPPGRFHRWSR